MRRFSERKGHIKISDAFQKDGINDALLNSLWNILCIHLWNRDGYRRYSSSSRPKRGLFKVITGFPRFLDFAPEGRFPMLQYRWLKNQSRCTCHRILSVLERHFSYFRRGVLRPFLTHLNHPAIDRLNEILVLIQNPECDFYMSRRPHTFVANGTVQNNNRV